MTLQVIVDIFFDLHPKFTTDIFLKVGYNKESETMAVNFP